MIQSEWEKLLKHPSEFLSIGITKDGEPHQVFPVYWKYTSTAYNMKLPKVFIAKSDLNDEKIMEKIRAFKVVGCYIYCALEQYDFLKGFPEMRDLNLFHAEGLKDLSFLPSCPSCRMLFLQGAQLESLREIYEAPRPASLRFLALYDCKLQDVSGLKESKYWFVELIVCNPKSRNERARWKGISGLNYYDKRE